MLKKWLPLVLLGLIGMFLSEFLIWNVFSFSQVLSSSVWSAVAMLLVSAVIYIVLFIVFVDVIQRFKVNDFTGVLILGMIYGLLLEGIFATKIFTPGIGCIRGLCFSSLGFTALSWHPLIDFLGGILILGLLFKGEFNLSDKKINPKEILSLVVFSLFWFIWIYAKWLLVKLPLGVPLNIQVLVLVCPMVVLGLVGWLTLKKSKNYVPEKIIGLKFYVVFLIGLGIFMLMRFNSLANKLSFVFFIGIILFYVLLFVFYMKTRKSSSKSIYEKCFPIKENFSLVKYLKACGVVIVSFVVLNLIVNGLGLERLIGLLDSFLYVLFLLFSVGFVIWVFGKIAKR